MRSKRLHNTFAAGALTPGLILGLILGFIVSAARCAALDNATELSQYGVQIWQVGNGLPQNTVNSVLQTRDGYLWAGTDGGLARFDGFRFAVFTIENTPALRSNNVRALFEDRSGVLWIGTSEGLLRSATGGFERITTDQGMSSDDVSSISLSPSGALTVRTAAGAFEFDGRQFAPAKAPPAGSHDDPFVQSVHDGAGRLWSVSSKGVTLSGGGLSRTFGTTDGLPSERITTLMADREDTVWIGTDSGLARIVNGRVESFPSARAAFTDQILSLAEDSQGNVWVGTDSSGLAMLRDIDFASYGKDEGANERIRCVLEDRRGRIWIGTNGSGLRFLDGKTSGQLTTADGLASNVVLSLAVDQAGDLWIGTPDGLNRLHGGKLSLLTSADGLAEDFIRSVYSAPDGSIWVGTRRGLSHIQDGAVQTYNQSNGLGSDVIGALLCGSGGELWIGTLDGLTRWKDGKFQNFRKRDGLSADVVTELFEDKEGTLWIGTQGGSVCYMRAGKIHRLNNRPEAPDAVFGITDDRFGNLWLAAKTGIFRVRKKDLELASTTRLGPLRIDSFGPTDGLRVSECDGGGHPAVWQTVNGAILFSTAKGVAVLRAGRTGTERRPPPVVLESVSVDERVLRPKDNFVLPPGHSRLDFEYAGIRFAAPQKVRYRYKLDGFDRDWVDAGTRRVASYTNLPPGHRRFHVIASSESGVWSDDNASLAFYLQPHFYQTWWFDAVVAGLGVWLIYLFNRLRVRQVQLRYDAILGERNRIAREIHDTLAQGFVGVSVQLEIASRLLQSSAVEAREHLDQARNLVRTSLADARQSIWELRSQSAQQEDFAAKLANAAKQTAGAFSDAKVQLQVHGTYRPLEPRIEGEMIRIGQEAVSNAVRHSGAGTISIDLAFEEKWLRMTVRDDGCGFEPRPQSSGRRAHFGLQGMRERAQSIGALLSVQSELNKGTQVSVEVQLN